MTIKADKLIKATFIIVLFQGIIASYLGFGLINYMCDAMILLTLVLMPFFKPKFKKGQKLILIPLVLFTMWVVVSAIYNEPNIYQTLWGVRITTNSSCSL